VLEDEDEKAADEAVQGWQGRLHSVQLAITDQVGETAWRKVVDGHVQHYSSNC
jgi:hypothetical protein